MTNQDNEEWRPLTGYGGRYQDRYEVTRTERVRSLERLVERKGAWSGVIEHRRGTELKTFKRTDGTQQVVLYDAAGRRHCHFTHKLVAAAFGSTVA